MAMNGGAWLPCPRFVGAGGGAVDDVREDVIRRDDTQRVPASHCFLPCDLRREDPCLYGRGRSSLGPQRIDRIHACGPGGRERDGEKGNHDQDRAGLDEHERFEEGDLEKQRLQNTAEGQN